MCVRGGRKRTCEECGCVSGCVCDERSLGARAWQGGCVI